MTGVENYMKLQNGKEPIARHIKKITMISIKRITLCLLWIVLLAGAANAQQKEWRHLLDLLQKEAMYFEGKQGFIQPENSNYNRFFIQEASVSDSLIVFGMWLRDQHGAETSEQYVKETLVLKPEPPIIISAEIYYDFSFYFKDFPKGQFLRIEIDDDTQWINKIENIYKDTKTGVEDRNEMEDKTNRILLPIRAKNRGAIFRAIDAYQSQTIKYDLEYKSMF